MKALLLAILAVAVTPLHRDMTVTSKGDVQHKRTELVFSQSADAALSEHWGDSPWYRSLNGEWQFAFASDESILGSEITEWGSIMVPGNWELQGYDYPVYTNTTYDFCTKNPQPPTLPASIPCGIYRKMVNIPDAWDSGNVYLNIGGAKGGLYLYVNGLLVGYSEDAKDLSRFKITPYIKEGEENEIRIEMTKWSTGSYLECMDFWRISGIERDVYLSYEPSGLYDFDFDVVSTLDDDMQTGVFRLSTVGGADVSYKLMDKGGRTVLEGSVPESGMAEGRIPSVRQWTAETPELYTLLLDVNGVFARFDVGFRRFEIVGNRFLINGKAVKFKGVNLHEHNQFTGHYITREQTLEDLKLMRRHNINAIRTCHYPQPRFFYELCDSLGFYVYSEANVESHGMGYALDRTLGNNPAWYHKHIDRIKNMYFRVHNYPCVTILSLGNEGGNGVNFYNAYNEIKALEKDGMNRPVCYERAEFEWNTDCLVPQYPGADWFRRMGEEGSDRPVFPSEYAHAMGNSTGSLDLQWEHIYKYDNLQGGFIWDWVDQGLAETTADGRRYWAYGGDYGTDAPSDNNFLCNGLVGPDRGLHPGIMEVKHVYQEASVEACEEFVTGGLFKKAHFSIFNRHYFTSLEGYKLKYSIVADGRRVKRGSLKLSAGPQSSEEFSIRLPWFMSSRKEYFVNFELVTTKATALLEKGHVLATDQILLREAKAGTAAASTKTDKVSVGGDGSLVLENGGARVVFDPEKGRITEYSVRGEQMIDSEFGLRPLWWRAPNDNDYGNGWPRRTQDYKQAGVNPVCAAEFSGDSIVVRYKAGVNEETVIYSLVDDALAVSLHFEGVPAEGRATEVPRIGMRMRLPSDCDAFSYYGRGPWENYWDRNSSAQIGLYNSSASAEFVEYVRPQECGHHTGARYLQMKPFTVKAASSYEEGRPCEFEFSVLRCSVEDLDSEDAVQNDYQWPNTDPAAVHDTEAARNSLRRQQHVSDIVDRDFVELCIDYRQSGVGGYDSWGATAENERTLWSDRSYDFAFVIAPRR